MSRGRVAVVTSGFPRCSETFALGELLALEERGALAAIFATKPGDGSSLQPGSERLMSRVRFLPEGPPAAQAAALVRSLGGRRVSGIHGYFAHLPAEVASLAAKQLGLPYGFSTHARDARKISPGELAKRAHDAACVIACNPDVEREISPSEARVYLVPHGVDINRFRPRPHSYERPLRLLAVGRLVEKKGFDLLIAAAARLSFPFQLRIIGEGPGRDRLEALIAATGLGCRVTLSGAMTHADLPDEYANAHAVIVPSIIDSTGDRDGLPNVILEAMAAARPVIASDVSAISAAIIDEETGLLVPPGDPVALTSAIERIARSSSLRARLGERARKRVEQNYEAARCAKRFCDLLESVYA
ncbi:MAG TPA: glycosyltransferase [Blastocatellia bacterium]|nr:glycosyltransferase [Blastocatellia bacterium]